MLKSKSKKFSGSFAENFACIHNPDSADELRLIEHIGVDEAGRGCLAGPVVAAAVLVPNGFVFSDELAELGDSKALPEAKRKCLSRAIQRSPLVWGIGLSWSEEVDSVNILCATFRAMSRAVYSLSLRIRPDVEGKELPLLLIDGNQVIPLPQWQAAFYGAKDRANGTLPLPKQRSIVHGDALVPAISAASILAKTYRDSLLNALAKTFPDYGFERHKGYGTKEHIEAIKKNGPSFQHRKTFRGVRQEEEQLSFSGVKL